MWATRPVHKAMLLASCWPSHQTSNQSPHFINTCIMMTIRQFGLCWTDLSTGETHTAVADDSSLHEHLVKLTPAEILIPAFVQRLSSLFYASRPTLERCEHVGSRLTRTDEAEKAFTSRLGSSHFATRAQYCVKIVHDLI